MGTPNDSFDDVDDLSAMLAGKSVKTEEEKTDHDAATKWALKLIDDFKSQQGSVWPGLERATVAGQLAERVKDSLEINQGPTWLCGVTSVVRDWADDCPIDYAWLGIQLFNLGRGRMGRGKLLGEVIAPSLALRRSSIPAMPQADWLVLASCHETLSKKYGMLGDSSYTSDEGLLHSRAWQTSGEVMGAFKAAGYKNVVDNTTYASHKGVNDLEKANDYMRAGYRVSLLINMRLLTDATIGTQAKLVATSNHWIGMLQPFNIIGDYMEAFDVFSWGKRRRVPTNPEVKKILVKDMLLDFYGFVAGRPY